ncbi:AAA domain-containing protein [Nocardia wallacei]|uniref:AAA domain-containing protein n=1 Tax=Nocardia wallacei TaxID=480035 RepID=UPI003CC7F6DB
MVDGVIWENKGLAELTFIHPGSALHRFLEGAPIEACGGTRVLPIYTFHTNSSQRDAAVNVLHQSISIIDGPGTGKTQTILNLVSNVISDESKTVAPTTRRWRMSTTSSWRPDSTMPQPVSVGRRSSRTSWTIRARKPRCRPTTGPVPAGSTLGETPAGSGQTSVRPVGNRT